MKYCQYPFGVAILATLCGALSSAQVNAELNNTKQTEETKKVSKIETLTILGKTNIENLFLNTGHGTLGWTMSLGSAKFISDIISCKPPDIDDSGLSIARYAH